MLSRRLFSNPSLQDLDAAFGAEVTAAFSSQLLQIQQAHSEATGQPAVAAEALQQQCQQHQQQLTQTVVWDVMMRVSVGGWISTAGCITFTLCITSRFIAAGSNRSTQGPHTAPSSQLGQHCRPHRARAAFGHVTACTLDNSCVGW